MKGQMMYRGEAKNKEKPTKTDKVYNYVAKTKRRAEARKKAATA
jgi:hypothetical protein